MRVAPSKMVRGLLALGLAGVAVLAACDEEAATLSPRRGDRNASSSGAGGDGGVLGEGGVTVEATEFSKVEPELLKSCGKGCHDTGNFSGAPPFLKGPDVYASIKAHPGIVTRDVFASALLTKGPHAGPALSSLADLEKAVITWLQTEAVQIQSQRLPSTPAAPVVLGDNDIDLTPAGTVPGCHLKFKAEMVGTILALSGIKLTVPAGTDVHILQPKFVRVLSAPNDQGLTDIDDPADSFSNSDQTVAGGTEAPLSPGSVLFSNERWRPFDVTKDKLRIEITKLEPGKVQQTVSATCADAAKFGTDVRPTIQATAAANGNCQNCHNANGLAGLNFANGDNAAVCNQVLAKLNKADIPKSVMVTKVTAGPHNGGLVGDGAAWQKLFVDNKAVFFKP